MGLYHVISTDAARTWTHLLRLGAANAAHADIAVIDEDRVAAVWDAAGARADAVFAAESRDGGGTWSAPERLSGAKAAVTHPRIVATPAGYRVFWTETTRKLGERWVMTELSTRYSMQRRTMH